MKLFILLIYSAFTFARKYLAELEYENPLVPCEDYPDLYVTTWMDYSNVTFNLLENNTLHIQGQLVIKEYIKDVVGMKMDAYKKERGVYVYTIFTINRENFCYSLFSPMEYWYPMVSSIPLDKRLCPWQKGMYYNFDIFADLEFDLPDSVAEGYYKLHFEYYYRKSKKVIMCYDIFANIFRL